MGPTVVACDQMHAEKYRAPGESYREAGSRWAGALKDDDRHFQRLRDIHGEMRFLAAGRVQAAMGSPRAVTPYNCFVSDIIDDSMVDGDRSIMNMATKAAATMRKGGGIGYSFGTLRPRGAGIAKLQSSSSGPISMMGIYDATCLTISSSGHRRGAQMGVLPIWHPDIEEFIRAKHPPKEAEPILEALDASEPGSEEWERWYQALQAVLPLTGFNVSVGVTDDFMEALTSGADEYPLRFGGKTYSTVNPAALWELLMRSTWDYAEPGVLFLDTINRMNNLWYCEEIFATNPCGEQPLPPNGACLLGSFNLTRYMHQRTDGSWYLSDDHLREDIPDVVRAMDNVVDRATYPLREQEIEAHSKRRMGLGVTGVANAFEAMALPYGSPGFLEMEAHVLDIIRDDTYRASVKLAEEKGSFPMFDADRYLQGEFVETLPEDVRDGIKRHGIRNSHLTSIAPTGTISYCADYVSSGIEPVFAVHQKRKVKTATGSKEVIVEDYGHRVFGVEPRSAMEASIDDHLGVLLTAAARVDSAVSKTVNVPADTPWDDFSGIYRRAWEGGAKGCTTYQVGGRRAGILSEATEEEVESACRIDPATGRRECD